MAAACRRPYGRCRSDGSLAAWALLFGHLRTASAAQNLGGIAEVSYNFLWASAAVMILYSWILRGIRGFRDVALARKNGTRVATLLHLDLPGDGLFALHEMGPRTNACFSTICIVMALIPFCMIASCCILGSIMGAIEKWDNAGAVAHVEMGMTLYEGQSQSMLPSTSGGNVFWAFVAIVIFLLINVCLSMGGSLRLKVQLTKRYADWSSVFVPYTVATVVSAGAVVVACAGIVALGEGWTYTASLMYAIDLLLTKGNHGLSANIPSTAVGLTACMLAALWFLPLIGFLVHFMSSHRQFISFMEFLEGSDRPIEKDPQSEDNGAGVGELEEGFESEAEQQADTLHDIAKVLNEQVQYQLRVAHAAATGEKKPDAPELSREMQKLQEAADREAMLLAEAVSFRAEKLRYIEQAEALEKSLARSEEQLADARERNKTWLIEVSKLKEKLAQTEEERDNLRHDQAKIQKEGADSLDALTEWRARALNAEAEVKRLKLELDEERKQLLEAQAQRAHAVPSSNTLLDDANKEPRFGRNCAF